MKKYRNLLILIIAFASLAYAGVKIPILGAYLGGFYLANGIAHFGYGVSGFGKLTPKSLFGDGRIIHTIWGLCNFAFSFVLIYFSLGTNWITFIAGVLITALLLPIAAKEKH